MALWGGRFEKGVDAFTQEFGASLEVDKAMAQQDIRASRAHARMLARRGIISDEDQKAIDAGLEKIAGEIKDGTFEWDVNDEDIHMAVESKLTKMVGAPGRVSIPGARGTTRWLSISAFLRRTSPAISCRETSSSGACF